MNPETQSHISDKGAPPPSLLKAEIPSTPIEQSLADMNEREKMEVLQNNVEKKKERAKKITTRQSEELKKMKRQKPNLADETDELAQKVEQNSSKYFSAVKKFFKNLGDARREKKGIKKQKKEEKKVIAREEKQNKKEFKQLKREVGPEYEKEKKITKKFTQKDWDDFDLIQLEYRSGGPQAVVDFIEQNREELSTRLKQFLNEEWLEQVKASIPKTEEKETAEQREVTEEDKDESKAEAASEGEKESAGKSEPQASQVEATEPMEEKSAEDESEEQEEQEQNKIKKAQIIEEEVIAESGERYLDNIARMINSAYGEKVTKSFVEKMVPKFDRPEDMTDQRKVLDTYNRTLERDNKEIKEQINTISELIKSKEADLDKITVNRLAHRIRRELYSGQSADTDTPAKDLNQEIIIEAWNKVKNEAKEE